jgi:hypothetical protein
VHALEGHPLFFFLVVHPICRGRSQPQGPLATRKLLHEMLSKVYKGSERDRLAISLRFVTASQMYCRRDGTLKVSCTARLVKNLPAWLTSPPPFEKKKLAPRRFCSLYLRATVRETVDFPVPARPFSQKMHCSSCPSVPSTQSYIPCRRSTRVSGRQAGSCWRS